MLNYNYIYIIYFFVHLNPFQSFAGYETYIPMGASESVRYCDIDYQRYPAYLINEDDSDIQKKGHYIDQGKLKKFQGSDHTIHDGDRNIKDIFDVEKTNIFQVRAIFN